MKNIVKNVSVILLVTAINTINLNDKKPNKRICSEVKYSNTDYTEFDCKDFDELKPDDKILWN
mgnify:CR=1 FL=1